MDFSPLVTELIRSLQMLPGVGTRSAQRMAMYLLESESDQSLALADTITKSINLIEKCEICQIYTEASPCQICQSNTRDKTTLCIVETPSDMMAIEAAMTYSGRYFILYGKLSPIDGIGPHELKLDKLADHIQAQPDIQELIIATNPTVEGEATAHYLMQLANQFNKKATRIAYGVPFGGELEYTDAHTLSRAFDSRA